MFIVRGMDAQSASLRGQHPDTMRCWPGLFRGSRFQRGGLQLSNAGIWTSFPVRESLMMVNHSSATKPSNLKPNHGDGDLPPPLEHPTLIAVCGHSEILDPCLTLCSLAARTPSACETGGGVSDESVRRG